MDLAAHARPARHMTLGREATASPSSLQTSLHGGSPTRTWYARQILLIVAGAIVLVWAAALFVTPRAHILVNSPSLNIANATAIFALRLTAAGIMLAFPNAILAPRLRWIGVGLLVQSIGSVVVARGLPWLFDDLSNKQLAYGMGIVWILSMALWLFGLLPDQSRSLSLRQSVVVTLFAVACACAISLSADTFPDLVSGDGGAARLQSPLHHLTLWHWAIFSIQLATASVCVAFTQRRLGFGGLGTGVTVSLIFFVGASVHYAIWPAAFSTSITSTSLLRLISITILVLVGIFHVHQLALNRTSTHPESPLPASDPDQVLARTSELGAVVAHELGSSIAAVRGYLEILSLAELDGETRRQTLENMRSETVVLGVLAEDIQSIGSVQQHLLTVSPFPIDLGVLIGDAVGFARALPGEHRYLWPDSLTMRVLADPERIAQVFRNLLTNAAKYTRPGDTIAIAVERFGTTVRISVIDHGPGISPADESRIFEKFDRGCVPNLAVPGSGVGLFVSRELVSLHGHDLIHTSTPGGGATFTFELDIVR